MSNFLRNKSFGIYTILWLLYLTQGAIWGESTVQSQAILIFLTCWSIRYLVKCYYRLKFLPSSLIALTILLGSYILYGLHPIICGVTIYIPVSGTEIPPFNYIKQALVSILPIFAFYYFSIKGRITSKIMCLCCVLFFVVLIINYYSNLHKLLSIALKAGSTATEFTNNSSYAFIYLIPYLYLFRKKKYSLVFIIGITIFLLLGMKRGAILIGMIGITLYAKDELCQASIRKKIILFIGFTVLCISLIYFISYLYDTSPLFRNRVEMTAEGNVSRRDLIADSLLDYWYDAGIMSQFFGSGANATILHAENFAHNDWLEMLVNQGIAGVVVLFSFYLALWIDVKKMKRYNLLYYHAFRTLFVMAFLKTLFSMSICAMLPYLTLPIGFFLAQLQVYKNLHNVKRIAPNIGNKTSLYH